MHSGLIKSGLPNPSPGHVSGGEGELSVAAALCQTLTPGPSPSQDSSLKTPQPGPSSFVVRSGVDPRPKPPPDPIELIAAGRHSVEAICRESKMSILELAAHICTPRNLEALSRVAQLHAIEREMLLGRLRIDALMRLRELTDEVPAASADEVRTAEIMRKACVDILRYATGTVTAQGSPRTISPSPTPPRDDGPEPLNEEKILAMLEQLGEEKYEYEPRAQAIGSVPPDSPPPSKTPPESHLSLDSISRNGPGACASGSYPPPPVPCPSFSHSQECENVRTSAGGTDSDQRESSVGPASTASNRTDDSVRKAGLRCQWHPGEPQATPGGEGVRGVEITYEGQVGMAFGKTSDHDTSRNRTGKIPVPRYARSTQNRTPKNGNRIHFDDAHPP